jgi:GWxTD domain-containing protein
MTGARALFALCVGGIGILGLRAGAPPAPSEKEQVKALPPDERQWLAEFVAPIITPEEKQIFLTLTEPYQRDGFRRSFWERREREGLTAPLGPGYRERYEELWKLAVTRYDGWRRDAGRALIRWGEPDEILIPDCPGETVFYGLEVWSYRFLGNSGRGSMKLIFFRKFFNGPFNLWSLDIGNRGVFASGQVCRLSFEELGRRDCNPDLKDKCAAGMCEQRCEVYRAYVEIKRRQGTPLGGMMETAVIFEPLPVPLEGLDREKTRWAITSDPKARLIHVEGPSMGPSPTPTVVAIPNSSSRTVTLSPKEVEERIEALPQKDREFLNFARPLMRVDELNRFLQMPSEERDAFVREFWEREMGPRDWVPPRSRPTPRPTSIGLTSRSTPTPR